MLFDQPKGGFHKFQPLGYRLKIGISQPEIDIKFPDGLVYAGIDGKVVIHKNVVGQPVFDGMDIFVCQMTDASAVFPQAFTGEVTD